MALVPASSHGGGAPTIAEVLEEGDDADGARIVGLVQVKADSLAAADAAFLSIAGGSIAPSLTGFDSDLAYDVSALTLGAGGQDPLLGGGQATLGGGDGDTDTSGGAANLNAGDGDDGNTFGASIQLGGGDGDGVTHGKAFVRTAGAFGAAGGTALVADGAGTGVVYGGVKTGSGAPAGAPDGFLPIYLDGASLYVWNGAAWQGPYTV